MEPALATKTSSMAARLDAVRALMREKRVDVLWVRSTDRHLNEYVPTDERSTSRFPLILTTGRILSQYNVGAQTRRTQNTVWHAEDILDIRAVLDSREVPEPLATLA